MSGRQSDAQAAHHLGQRGESPEPETGGMSKRVKYAIAAGTVLAIIVLIVSVVAATSSKSGNSSVDDQTNGGEGNTTETGEKTTEKPNEPTKPTPPVKPVNPIDPLKAQSKRVLAEFSSNIKASVDPCDDFYEFACGSFNEKYPILNNKSEVNYFSLYTDQAYPNLLKKLKGADLLSKETYGPLKYVKKVWDSCVQDTNKDEMAKVTKYFKELDRLKTWHPKFVKLMKDGYNVLFNVKIGYGIKSTDDVIVGPPELEAPEAYSSDKAEDLATYYSELINLYKPEAEKEEQLKLAREISEFERSMSTNTSTDAEKAQGQTISFMTIKDLNLTTDMNWNFTLRKIFAGEKVFDTSDFTKVVVSDVKYINNFKQIFEGKNDAFLGNYFKLAVLRQSCFFLGKECRDHHFKMSSALEKFDSWDDYAEKKCFNTLDKYFHDILFKIYQGFDLFDTFDAGRLVENVKQTANHFVSEISWMDKDTKDQALKRFDESGDVAIKEPPHLTAANYLIKKYKELPHLESTEEVKIFDYIKSISKYSKTKQLRYQLDGEMYWPLSLFSAHPLWSEVEQRFFVPNYFVNGPFVVDDVKHILYGYFGSLLAHEMTHKFDALAANYSRNHKLKRLSWSESTRSQFDSKMQCLIDAYDGQEVNTPEPNKINGTSTLNENLADLIGLNVAYESFKNNSKTYRLNATELPDLLKDMANDKLFFLSYANVHCSNDARQLPVELNLGVKSPRKMRVNFPLAQSEKFAQAFSCKTGSKMNPEKRCPIK